MKSTLAAPGMLLVVIALGVQSGSALAVGPTAKVTLDYLMTYKAYLGAEYAVGQALTIVQVTPGGWARGPRINATFVGPAADWLRVLPSGALRIDVRATLRTYDGALIFMSYNGVLREGAAAKRKLQRGEVAKSADFEYCIGAPTFQTDAPRYNWLNGVQTVNKLVALKDGKGGYAEYDVFIVR